MLWTRPEQGAGRWLPHTVNDAVLAYGEALLEADVDRVGPVTALGMDETLFARVGMWRRQLWSTSIVDVRAGVLLDVVGGRGGSEPAAWLAARGDEWRKQVEWATLDLSSPYRAVFNTMLPDATQIADPFHLVKLANSKLDECRRRVQNETLGHRGRKTDPLYRIRRLLTKADERLDDKCRTKLLGLLAAGDPRGEVKTTWHAKEVIRSIYEITEPEVADEFVTRLASDLQDTDHPIEIRSLGRTLKRWHDQIVAWHRGRVSNGPTEADQQSHQEGQTDRLRVSQVSVFPDPGVALRGQPQLGPTRHRHSPLKSEVPDMPGLPLARPPALEGGETSAGRTVSRATRTVGPQSDG